jgi:SAM-dependent methyltransferase
MYRNYTTCRISGSNNLVPFFHINAPLAGGFLRSGSDFANDPSLPLTVSFCPDSGLVQVNEVVNANTLFKKYFYKTGAIRTLATHFEEQSSVIRGYGKKSALEVGCNDFSMLKHLVGSSYQTLLGVDPSDVSSENRVVGVELENTFFSSSLAKFLLAKYGKFDVIAASNCFAHIEDIRDVTLGMKTLLNEDGVIIIEVYWLGGLVKNLQFPFIYHEHMYYYSLQAMSFLMKKFGLEVFGAEHIETHGGSIRFFCGHIGQHEILPSVRLLEKEEADMRLSKKETFIDFQSRVAAYASRLNSILIQIKNDGKTIYGYGASGQANIFMAVCDVQTSNIPYIIDDSPLKIGCYTPSNHIPIVSNNILQKFPPDYILCFSHAFFSEIRARNKDYVGRWIIPFPTLEIV